MLRMGDWMRNYLARTILSYCIFVVLLIGIIGIYLINKSNLLYMDEVTRDTEAKLTNIRDYTEQLYLKKFEFTSLGKLMSTMRTHDPGSLHSEVDLLYFSNRPVHKDMLQVSRLNSYLRSLTIYHPGIVNAMLVFEGRPYVIDSHYFYADYTHSPDAAFIERLQQEDPYQWNLRMNAEGKRVITYINTLPYRSSGEHVKGYLYIDVDPDHMLTYLHGLMNPDMDELRIVDDNGQTILASAQAGENQQEDPAVVVSHSEPASSVNNWTYELRRTVDSYTLISARLKQDVLRISLIVLSIGLLISIGWSLSVSAPVRRMLDSMHSKIHSLNDKLRDRQIARLLFGEHDEVPVPYEAGCTVVAIGSGNREAGQLRQLCESMIHKDQCEVVSVTPDEIVLLYRNDAGKPDMTAFQRDWQAIKMGAWPGALSWAGISMTVRTAAEVRIAYRQAQQAGRYAFLFGSFEPVFYADICTRDRFPYELNESRLENMLLAGDAEGFEKFICKFRDDALHLPYTIEAVELALMQIITLLSRAAMTCRLDDLFAESKQLHQAMKNSTLDATVEAMVSFSAIMAERITQGKTDDQAETLNELIRFIEEKLDQDISLDMLADHISMSPSYISKLFREVLHVSFSDYLTLTRMNRAAGLLANTSYTVTDIAAKVGYSNTQYFCNRFKKCFGITPLQYRAARAEEMSETAQRETG